MNAFLVNFTEALMLIAFSTGMFFFVTTRGALLVRALLPGKPDPAAHVYPLYSNPRLMRLIDFQPVIAAILLFQYPRLVSLITGALRRMDLRGKRVLITSCAFGNVIPRVVRAAAKAGAGEVQLLDIVETALQHAGRKVPDAPLLLTFHRQDATALRLADGSVHANVLFFLLHELPHPQKRQTLEEACRVLAPGGKLFVAEFHRPQARLMRALSWTYFKIFEPLGLALWSTHDPAAQIEAVPGMRCERRTVFFGNFQLVVATKMK